MNNNINIIINNNCHNNGNIDNNNNSNKINDKEMLDCTDDDYYNSYNNDNNDNNIDNDKDNENNEMDTPEFIEPLLDDKNRRFTMSPIKHHDLWQLYKTQQNAYWKTEEIDFSKDLEHFRKLSKEEQHFIKSVLAFFAASDGIVNFNLSERFMKEIKLMEATVTYGWQYMMENIHCVSSDTLILTDKGYIEIGKYENHNVKVWNGKEFSDTTIKFTGISELYKVTLSNGMILKCTPNHKWFIYDENKNNNDIIFTKDLKINSIIKNYELPFINNYISNGTVNYDLSRIPFNESLNYKISWLEKLFENYLYLNGQIMSFHENSLLLNQVQLMLTSIGVFSEINEREIIIAGVNLCKLYKMGFMKDKLVKYYNEFEKCKINYDIYIKKIEKLDGQHDTYCFCEPKEHAGIFNGILTGQSETYSTMLEKIVDDENERNELFNAISSVESIKMMADWAFKWIESSKSFAHRVLAFACIEGIFFSGAFASIFWLKKFRSNGENFMNGLVKSNQLISRDEGMHCVFACTLYKKLVKRLNQEVVHDIIKDAVKISNVFVRDAIRCDLIGMNLDLMKEYIQCVADRLSLMLGYEKIYNSVNPFDFMESIGLLNKTNFFESRPTEYQSAYNQQNVAKDGIVLLEDF